MVLRIDTPPSEMIVTATGSDTGRTLADRFAQVKNIKDFGATVASSDNAEEIQAAIDAATLDGGGIVFIPPGAWLMGALTLPSNVELCGVPGASILKAISSLSVSSPLIQNGTQSSFTDSNIGLKNLVIDGNGLGAGGSQTRTTALVIFARVTALRMSGVAIKNHEYIGLALGGCRDVLIDGCEFTDCGYDGTTSNGGPALWVGPRVTDMGNDIRVVNSRFHDNRWHGVTFVAQKSSIRGNVFKDNEEAHIFLSRDATNLTEDIVIDGNVFDGVTQRDISASAIETGAHQISITNNLIRNCEANGIAVSTKSDGVEIANNQISNFNTGEDSDVGIAILTVSAAPDSPKNITISGNRIFDDQGTPTGYAAIRCVDATGDDIAGLYIEGNDVRGEWTNSGGLAIVDDGVLGEDCKFVNNIGAIDYSKATAVYNAFTTPATAGRKAEIHNLVETLVLSGIWEKLDVLYVLAAHSSQAALINWIKPGTLDLTATNSPTFEVDRGYTGNGATSYLSPGAALSTFTRYTLNSAHVGAYCLTDVAENGIIIGPNGVTNVRISPRNASDALDSQINDAATLSKATIGTSVGHSLVNRSGAALRQLYKDGAAVANDAQASTAVPTNALRILAGGSLYSTVQCAAAHAGGSLTEAEVATLYSALNTYMRAVGAA